MIGQDDDWMVEHCNELEDENKRLKQWISDCQSGMYINCVYCGHRYGPAENTPCCMADVLKKHIEECPEHPMSHLKKELDKLMDFIKTEFEHELIEGAHEPVTRENVVEIAIRLLNWLND